MAVAAEKPLTILGQAFLETQILPRVNKPARYLGIEHGAYRKNPAEAAVRMAMIFPDLYEIGVSNYGHKLLYSLVNNHPDYLCDRAYAPAHDMRELLRVEDIPLYGIETLMPLKDFEMLAFTLQYELNYTTILGVLESAQIPFRTVDRPDWSTPILIAGGPGSGNPKPLAPFFDAIILGDGEEVLIEILDLLKGAKAQAWTKQQTREALSKIEGVYLPGLSQFTRKRIVDITQTQIEIAPLIPYIQTVHDRVVIEARRGCDRMCRFCQPCFVNLPVREQKIEAIRDQALKEIAKTGYEECSLLSLSIADYSQLKPLIKEVANALNDQGVSLSLPSQRADRFDLEVAEAVQQVRKSTLTFAPEAGSERLRNVLNKNLTEAEILNAVISSYQAGWNKVKLYFMIGLPTETDADLIAIADLVRKMQEACVTIARTEAKSRKKHLEVNVTFSNFVPKPHTPFQWIPQDSLAELYRKRDFLRNIFQPFKGVKLNFTDPEISKLEAVISKGDERMADVIEQAYRTGGYLDAWDENLKFPEWFAALQAQGIDPDDYTATAYTDLKSPLPWDDIHMGLDRFWLEREYHKAFEAAGSDPCFVGCNTCGVCNEYQVVPVFIKPSEMKDYRPEHDTAQDKATIFPPAQYSVRLRLQKQGQLKFISQLDWLRMLHRAIARAEVPIAHSQGFNPKPKVSFGPALPLFVEGLSEYIDLDLIEGMPDIVERLNAVLPPDGQVLEAQWMPLYSPSVDQCVESFQYSAWRTCDTSDLRYTLKERLKQLMDEEEWIVDVPSKKGTRRFNIKPFISELAVGPNAIGPSQETDKALSHFANRPADEQVMLTIRFDRTGPIVKPQWFLNQLAPSAVWDIVRLSVQLRPSSLKSETPVKNILTA